MSDRRSDPQQRDARLEELRRAVRRDARHEIDDEVRFHLEGVEEELHAAGLSADEARAAAQARFGNVETIAAEMFALATQRRGSMRRSERVRAALRDVQYAWRSLRRAPAFSITVLVTLALGIGATMAIFTVAYGIWLKPLPYADPGRLVTVNDRFRGGSGGTISAAEIGDFRANRALEDVAAYTYGASITTMHDQPLRVLAYRVTPNLFSVLGVRAALGRTFDGTIDEGGTVSLPVVLSDAFWRARYGADPTVIGRRLQLFDAPATIIGVMPPRFHFPQAPASDVWVPLDVRGLTDRSVKYTQAIARLRSGYTLDEANAEMAVIGSRLATAYPESNAGWTVSLTPLVNETIGEYRTAFGLLLGIVGALLLIICANIASLFLARNTARQRELTLRAALGASRTRLALQVTAESLVLSLIGGALGLGLATLGASGLASMLPPAAPRLADVGIDGAVVSSALALSILTGLLCSLVPALRASVVAPASALQEGGHTVTGRHRLQNYLVVFEVAISLALLVGAGAIVRSFAELTRRDRGFVAEDLLTMHVTIPFDQYRAASSRTRLLGEALSRIRALPGVRGASAVTGYPGSGMGYLGGGTVAADPNRPEEAVSISVRASDPAYFSTMGTPLLAGRAFSESDGPTTTPVMIVNQMLAHRLWPGEDALGKRLALPASMDAARKQIQDVVTGALFTVVGVAADMHLGSTSSPQVFIPWSQMPAGWVDVVIRTDGNPAKYISSVRSILVAVERGLLVEQVVPMSDVFAEYSALERSQTVIAAGLGALAAVLSAVGIFGLLSYLVGQRRREFGVRLALGARSRDVFTVVLRRGVALTLVGIALGGLAAKGLVVVLQARVFGLVGAGSGVFASAAALMLAVAIGAALAPALRAARVDPMASLR